MGRGIKTLKCCDGVEKLCRNFCNSIVDKHKEKLSIYIINTLIISKIISMDTVFFSNHKEVFKLSS